VGLWEKCYTVERNVEISPRAWSEGNSFRDAILKFGNLDTAIFIEKAFVADALLESGRALTVASRSVAIIWAIVSRVLAIDL